MRDPRLVEIEFLMDLETHGMLQVRSTLQEASSFVQLGQRQTRYGVDPMRFRDLVVGLLLRGAIVGTRARGESNQVNERELHIERQTLIETLIWGQPINVALSHDGRVHMWKLRDELLRDPEFEPMGLRSMAAWERDLLVRMCWATKDEPLAIIFLDLDDFDRVRNELGADVEEDVLRASFSTAQSLVAGLGYMYRLARTKIGILLPAMGLEVARSIAEDLRRRISNDVLPRVRGLQWPQTASLGVATFDAAIATGLAVERVDRLMRTAKLGGDRVATDDA